MRLVDRRDKPVDRSDVDDPSATALGHDRQRRPHRVKGARKVDGHDRVPDGGRRLGERHCLLNAGIIDENVGDAPAPTACIIDSIAAASRMSEPKKRVSGAPAASIAARADSASSGSASPCTATRAPAPASVFATASPSPSTEPVTSASCLQEAVKSPISSSRCRNSVFRTLP